MTIAVIGLGKAGLPLSAVIAEKGLKVIGIDINIKRCKQINQGINPIPEEPFLTELIKKHGGKKLLATTSYNKAKNCNIYIIITPLSLNKNNKPDYRLLKKVSKNTGRILKKGDCVILETTVPPLTTETLFKKWLEKTSHLRLGEFYLAHSPERIMTGYSISRLNNFPKIIGGVNKESGVKAYNIYHEFMPRLKLVSSARVAEFTKIIEGCYRFINISLANELFKIAEELHIDFFEAKNNANHKYCNIHQPSVGVGGHCIPVYPQFLINEMKKRGKKTILLNSSYVVDAEMLKYWANKIIMECIKINKPLNSVKICVKGITFRKGVKSLIKSKNLELVNLLIKKRLNIFVYDEMFSAKEIKKLGLKFINPEKADIVFNSFLLKIDKMKGLK